LCASTPVGPTPSPTTRGRGCCRAANVAQAHLPSLPRASRAGFLYELQLDEDFAKAAAYSLEESGLVRRSFFTFGGGTEEADYVLRGTAKRTQYNGKVIS